MVLSLSHVALQVLIQLRLFLELRLKRLFFKIESILLLFQLPVLILGLFEFALGLYSFLDLVLEVILGADELGLGEVHHLGLELLEEPGGGKLCFNRLSLCLNEQRCCTDSDTGKCG